MMRPLAIGALVLTACAAGGAREAARTGTGTGAGAGTPATRDAELAALAERALDAPALSQARVTRSGAVVFVSTRDGLPQLYVGDAAHPEAPARRLPTPRQRVIGVTLTSDERAALFLSDTDGDGSFHVSMVGLDGRGLVDLTPGETLHRDRPFVARAAAGLFAYSAHATKDERTSVRLQRLDDPSRAPREVYSDARGGALADLAPDGAHALFVQFRSSSEQVLFEIDVASGAARRIHPPEDERARVDASYSADGATVFVTTQSAGRRARALAIERSTGRVTATYEETALPDASLDQMIVAPSGDRVVLGVDGGDHTEIRVLDAKTMALARTVPLAPCLAQLGDFSADGARFTVMLSRPDDGPSVHAVDARTGAMTALRREPPAAHVPLEASIVAIRAFDGLTLPTNLYLPAGAATDGRKRPVLVSIHGGPSASAYLRWDPDVQFFVSLGYAVVQPNIRGSTGFGVAFEEADDREKRGDAVKDVAAVHDWAAAQPWCDPSRMVIGGQSYGGYMTLVTLTQQPELWAAGVERSGMSDLRTMEALEDQAIRVYDETEFGKVGRDDATLLAWSPLKDVARVRAPLFVYQGVNDPVTPQREADQIVAALRARGVPVEYMLSADEGHGIVRKANRIAFLTRAARFLDEHLGIARR